MTVIDFSSDVHDACAPLPLGTISITDEAKALVLKMCIDLVPHLIWHAQESTYGKTDDHYKHVPHRIITTNIPLNARFPNGEPRVLWIITNVQNKETVFCMETETLEFLGQGLSNIFKG